MLSRLLLNIGRLAQNSPNKYAAVDKCPRQKTTLNYVTVTPNYNVPTSTSLNSNVTNGHVPSKLRISNNDLESLLTNLKFRKCKSAQALEILRCFSIAQMDQKQTNIVTGIWNELKKQHNDFQTKHYNYMMQHTINNGEPKHVQSLFDEMIDTHIQPDALSYRYLVEAYCKAGKIDRANEVIGLMIKAKICSDESSLNHLAQCHIICGNLDAASKAIENLKEIGHNINVDTMNALINYCAKSGDLENIEKTFKLFNEQDSDQLNHHVLNLMCEMSANGHEDKIDKLIAYIKPSNKLRQSFKNAITQFVERNQSPIVPRILQLTEADNEEMIQHLTEEMVRCSTSAQEYSETIANIEAKSTTKPATERLKDKEIQDLLKHMKSKPKKWDQYEFVSLLQLAAKKSPTEVLNVVESMCTDFDIQPKILFIRGHILPALNVQTNPHDAFAQLQTTKIHSKRSVLAIISSCLTNADIQSAHDFGKCHQRFYGIRLIREPLLSAFKATSDVSGFVSFVRLILDSFLGIDKSSLELNRSQKTYNGEILASAISNCQTNVQLISQLLTAFIDEGLTITTEQADNIQNTLEIDSDTEIGQLLKKLCTEPLLLRPIEIQRDASNILNEHKLIDVQNMLEVKQKHRDTSAANKQIVFLKLITSGSISKIEPLLNQNSDYDCLIDLYGELSDLENAMKILKRACAKNPSFKLNCVSVAKLVELMIENGEDFSKIEELLRNHRPRVPRPRLQTIEEILKILAACGCADLVEKLFHSVRKYGYVDITAKFAGPLVSVHIVNRTLAEAVDKYEYLAKTFKFVAETEPLFSKLIEKNEMDLLKRASDTLVLIHRNKHASAQVAFAFVECCREPEARKTLETLDNNILSVYISKKCKQYVKYGRLDAAKTLLKATEGLSCDRQEIHQAIFEISQTKH